MQDRFWLLTAVNMSLSLKGSGLLSQYGDHAQGREAPQRHDRPPAEKGTAVIFIYLRSCSLRDFSEQPLSIQLVKMSSMTPSNDM